jgi:hypothetical protein
MAGVHKDDSKNAGANISAKERFYGLKSFKTGRRQRFLQKEINGFVCPEIWPQDCLCQRRQKLRMNPMRNLTQITQFCWRKRAAVFY